MRRKLTTMAALLAAAWFWNAQAYNNPHILEVDLDIEGVVDTDEFSPGPGGFVASNGWKRIFLHYTGTNLPTKTRLNWDSEKIEVDGRPGPDQIYWDPASTMPTQLWVKGLAASDTGPSGTNCGPEHLTLEAINNGTPYVANLYDRVAFTVVAVTNIEYCRKDLDAGVAANWAARTNVAVGAKATSVHNARVRISIKPAAANVPVAAALVGGGGGSVAAALTPLTAQLTDAAGHVFCDYTSGDKMGSATVVVSNLADSVVNVDLGSTVSNAWDIADTNDFMIPEYFIPEAADDVRFYPTLETAGGGGAIDTHTITNYVCEIEILKVEYNLTSGAVTETTITGTYPSYWSLATIPYTVQDFVEISAATEPSPGIYKTFFTVHDQWDFYFDDETGDDKLIDYLVMGFSLGTYDKDVVYGP